MRFSEVFKITKPTYQYFRVTPNNSVRNQTSHRIARTIATLYKNVFQRIKQEETKIIKMFGREFLIGTQFNFNTHEKVAYYIYIEKDKVEFYFIIPQQHESLISEKLKDTWSNVTIEKVDVLPHFSKTAVKYQLQYTKEDALSLSVDRRDNELLRSNLNITSVLNKGDKVGLFYNFIPTMQHTWVSEHKQTMIKVKNKEPVDRDKSKMSYLFKYSLSVVSGVIESILETFTNNNTNNNNNSLENALDRFGGNTSISPSTTRKEHAVVLDTQILVMSESRDRVNQHNNAKSLAQSFEVVAEDNRLISKLYNKEFGFTDYKIKGAQINKISDVESQSFISLAGRDILEEYDFIEKVVTHETQVPKELQKGTISIGYNTYRGSDQLAYLSDDNEYKNLALMLVGPTRSGKSTLIGNLSNDAINNGECVIMFDFVKNCELSEEVAQVTDKNKVLYIDCNDFNNLQGLGYNEVGYDKDTFRQYDNAKRQTTQLMTLVNSINAEDIRLTAKMERYLTSAALIVFINGGSIKDVFDVLQNHNIRSKFVNKVPKQQLENLSEYILSLSSLDDYDKNGELVGSKLNLIVGIIDRLNKLKANTYMELMLKKGTKNNIDLSRELQKNQLICLRMPEDMFSTDGERDVYTTYWITKLWLSLQMRAKRIKDRNKHVKVNLIIDEIYQVNNTEKFLTEKLSRLAKFSIKPIISCHYINQLKYMREELRSANTSYMLISGCDKNNYNEFKEELYPFELNDLLKLPRFNSMNLIKHQNGYGKFITKLPKPVNV